MAKNELISLALISNGPAHAYGLNMILSSMQLETLAKISKASLYNALTRLEADKCIIVAIERVGNMPERKVYTITDQGKARLQQELKAMLLSLSTEDSPMHLAGIFAFGLEAEETLALIKQRIEKLRANIFQHEKKLEWYERNSYHPLAISARATIQHQKVEIQAAQDFIALLKTDPDYYKRLGQTLLQCMNQE